MPPVLHYCLSRFLSVHAVNSSSACGTLTECIQQAAQWSVAVALHRLVAALHQAGAPADWRVQINMFTRVIISSPAIAVFAKDSECLGRACSTDSLSRFLSTPPALSLYLNAFDSLTEASRTDPRSVIIQTAERGYRKI